MRENHNKRRRGWQTKKPRCEGLGASGAQNDQFTFLFLVFFLFLEEIFGDCIVRDLAEGLDVDHTIGVEFHRHGAQEDEGCSVL